MTLTRFQWSAVTVVSAFAASIAILALGLWASGYDAPQALAALWDGAFGSWYAFTSATLLRAVPLIIIGLGFALALEGGALNIGAEGQFYAGAIAATWIGLNFAHWPAPLAIGTVLSGATIAGAVWMVVPVWLKLRFGVIEVITTLLLNFVAAMLGGALAAALGALQGGPWVGVLAAALAGAVVAGVFALVAVVAGADQIITGTALTLASFGLTGALYRQLFGAAGVGLSIPTLGVIEVPVLHAVPIMGPAFFAQPAPTYLAMIAVPVLWWVLFRTRWGLALRAVGESPVAARAAGVRVRTTRSVATIVGGALAGLGGASLVLAQVGTFAEKMTAGRGFVAIAIVVLGRWHPIGVAIAALVFGAASALQFVFQAMGLDVPYQLFLMLPYVLTLLALAGVVGRVRPPASLGRPIAQSE